jgi:uncharacterized repeat protein (TIGR01451 family)
VRLGHGLGATVALVLLATLHPPHFPGKVDLAAGTTPAVGKAPGRVDADEPPAGLSHGDWNQIRQAMAESEYDASRTSEPGEPPALRASNRQQGYRTTFQREGIEIAPQAPRGAPWRLGISVVAYGYEGDVRAVDQAEPQALEERIEYRRGPLTEWYANRPGGLEQGFELHEPKSGHRGPLVIAMAVHGDLDISGTSETGLFADPSGATVVRYAGLKAWDAAGQPLRSHLEAVGRELRVVVDSQTTRFPVTVDPTFVHEAQLFGHGDLVGQPFAGFGTSVSVWGDTAVIGAPGETTTVAAAAGAVYVFVRSGTTWSLQQKLLAADGAPLDRFGCSVALAGDTAIVGAKEDDTTGGPDTGSAYVFVRSGTTWSQQQKLVAADGTAGDLFGAAVALSGDTAVVGAYFNDPPPGTNAGAAYVFVRSGTTWTQQQKLLASDEGPGDQFGYSVAIDGDTLAVGANSDDTAAGADVGAAYVFVRSGTTWTEQRKLLASDGAPFDNFGVSVSVSAETAVVGAYGDDVSTGSAYVFVRSGTVWSEQQKLVASDAAQGDIFGAAVSVSGDTVVVGAPNHDTAGFNAGSAYVFVRSGTIWTEQQKIEASNALVGDSFGASVSVSVDTAFVGANRATTPGGQGAGSAYVFVRTGTIWTEQQVLRGSDSQASDFFGWSVSVSGDTAVVGAYLDEVPAGQNAGSAYIFVRSGTVWTEQQKLVPSGGAAGDDFGWSVSVSGDTAVVGAYLDDIPGQQDAGSAYVFVRSGTVWTEQQKLLASDAVGGDWFGHAVSISGDTLLVGAARGDVGGGLDTGAAYVFVRSGTVWTEQQKLVAPDAAAFDLLGFSASISGDTAATGAPFDDTPGSANTGSAYVFVRSGATWTLQQKLVPPDLGPDDRFGQSMAISADTVVVGAPEDDNANGSTAGSAYVFVRSGATWTQQQKLLASDGATNEQFGYSVTLSGDTLAVGAPGDNPSSVYILTRTGTIWNEQQKLLGGPDRFGHSAAISGDTVVVGAPFDATAGINAGSAHVFRQAQADLGVTKTDGQAAAIPGEPITYTIVASNAGPTAAAGVTIVDIVPAELQGAAWTCLASPGSSCTASGSGNINDTVNLALGGSATYTLTGTVSSAATGTLTNTATVTPPPGVPDPNATNNSATDTDALTPQTDLAVTKTDSADPVFPGDPLGYALSISNAGPSDATLVTVTDALPSGVTFVSSSPGPPVCSIAGATVTCGLGTVAAGGNAAVTINVTVNASAGGNILNTATVSGNEADPDPANNSASATTAVIHAGAELAHGTDAIYDLAAMPGPVVDEDVFRISQKPHSSYEIVIDATSGDIGNGAGPILERIGADGATVLQASSAVGAGPCRSLRWRNTTAAAVQGETIRVRSAGCGTDCGPDDVYRIRAYETTYSVARFNNAGSQVTVLVLQNPTNYTISGDVYFQDTSGTLVAFEPFSLSPKQTLVLNTAVVPGASGVGGAVTIAHDGRYGDLAGKTVALEPATGFSFDSALEVRPK